jgi:glyoxylase I family protein
MSFQTSGLHHVAIRVTDLARARTFYVDTLGFQPVLELPGLIIVNANGSLVGIRGDAPETARGDSFNPFRVGLDHLALGVGDINELGSLKEQLDRSGVRNNGIEEDPVLGAKYISFYDPDGIALELYAMPGPRQ